MKTATYHDAILIARILDLDPDSVWEMIRGTKLEIVSISSEGSCIHEEFCRELVKSVEDALSESAGRTE
jgi:hypothetical protein